MNIQNPIRILFICILIALIGFIAWNLKTIVIYLAISIVISLIGQPLVTLYSKIKIKNFKLSNGICAALALFTLFGILMLFISLFIPLVVEEARIISQINPNEVVATFQEPLKNLESTLQKYNISYGNAESLQQFIASQLASVLGLNQVSSFAQGIFGFTASLIGATFAILFMSFFFMKDKHMIYNVIILLTPNKYIEAVKEILKDTKRLLTKYFLGIIADMAFVAILVFLGLTLVGVKNALLIGVFAGLMNMVPYIGPIMGYLFGILIASTTNLEMEFHSQFIPMIGKTSLVFVAVQLIDSLIFQPLVISNIVKAHPLEIFLVILVTGTFFGIGGMIIAVPTYTILRIIAKEFFFNFKIVRKLTENLDEDDPENKIANI